MKNKIREGIFETNSSSVHSLVLMNQKLSKPNLRELRINKDGIIKIPLGYFGKDYRIYSSQKEKLSYIMTAFYCCFGEDINKFNDDSHWDSSYWSDIKMAIIEYINKSCPDKHCIDIIPVYPKKTKNAYGHYGYYDWEVGFDHQTYPNYLSDCIVNLYNPQKVLNFIFNKDLVLETNCD